MSPRGGDAPALSGHLAPRGRAVEICPCQPHLPWSCRTHKHWSALASHAGAQPRELKPSPFRLLSNTCRGATDMVRHSLLAPSALVVRNTVAHARHRMAIHEPLITARTPRAAMVPAHAHDSGGHGTDTHCGHGAAPMTETTTITTSPPMYVDAVPPRRRCRPPQSFEPHLGSRDMNDVALPLEVTIGCPQPHPRHDAETTMAMATHSMPRTHNGRSHGTALQLRLPSRHHHTTLARARCLVATTQGK